MKYLFLEMLLVSFSTCIKSSVTGSPAQNVNKGLLFSGDITWAGAHHTKNLLTSWPPSPAQSEARVSPGEASPGPGAQAAGLHLETQESKRTEQR